MLVADSRGATRVQAVLNRARIIELAARHRLPVLCEWRDFVAGTHAVECRKNGVHFTDQPLEPQHEHTAIYAEASLLLAHEGVATAELNRLCDRLRRMLVDEGSAPQQQKGAQPALVQSTHIIAVLSWSGRSPLKNRFGPLGLRRVSESTCLVQPANGSAPPGQVRRLCILL